MAELTLDLGSIMTPDEIENLFMLDNNTNTEEKPVEGKSEEKPNETTESNDEEDNTSEIDLDDSESVGSNNVEGNDFYSTIATALKKEGILDDIEDPTKILNAEDLQEAIEKHISNRMDDRTKRVDEALRVGVLPNILLLFESAKALLESITEDALAAETEDAENLRRTIMMKDYLNRGFSLEKAERDVERSINSGSDIEDAKEALESLKENLNADYKSMVEAEKKKLEDLKAAIKKSNDELKESILNEEVAFGSLEVTPQERQKAFEALTKPVYKDPETGNYLTAIQKFQKEHPKDYWKAMAIYYVKTEGFSKLGNLIKSQVKKEKLSALRELEKTINHSSFNSGGSLRLASGIEDSESVFKGYQLDI